MPKEILFNRNYVLLCIANFLFFFSFYLILPIMPLYLSEQFVADKSVIGMVIACYSVATLIVRPFSGNIMDGYNRKAVYILAFSLFTAVFAGYVVAQTLLALVLVRVLYGLTFGLTSVSSNTLVIDLVPSSRRGEGIGFFGISSNLAMALGPMVGLMMHGTVDYQWIFVICLATSLVGVVIASQIHARYRPPLIRPKVSIDRFILLKGIPGGVAYILIAFPYGQISNYIAMYIDETGVALSGGMFFVLYAVGLILSRLYAGKMVDRGRKPQTVVLGIALLLAGIGLLAAVRYLGGTGAEMGKWLLIATAVMCGAGYGTIFTSFNTMFIDLAHHNQRGSATATYLTAWDLGLGLGVFAGGALAERFSFSFGYCVADLVLLLGLVYFVSIVVPHYKRNIVGSGQ
jgi:MFS family permease